MNLQGEQTVQMKIPSRFPENNGYAHVVLQKNKKVAEKAIQVGRLLIEFRSCRMREFQEEIRCRGFKGYGHRSSTCKLLRYCRYCANLHDSAQCPIKKDPTKHQCVSLPENRNHRM